MSGISIALQASLLAFAICSITLAVLSRFPYFLIDIPNQRSLHSNPIPRTGGIGIILGALISAGLLLPEYLFFVVCDFAIASISLVDDWRRLSALSRFAAQSIIAGAFCFFGFGQIFSAEGLFILLAIVWMANLFNFMDGSDGLAGGMAFFGFATCAIGAIFGGNSSLFILCICISSATLPFLFLNFHPAKIFMGDVGAVTLGFSAAAIGTIGWRDGVWSPFFPVFVFSPFIADASLTLLQRILARKRFWQPHREHYFQKLVQMGWGHRKTALAEYVVMGIASLLAVSTALLDGVFQLIAITIWGAVLITIAHFIDVKWKKLGDPLK